MEGYVFMLCARVVLCFFACPKKGSRPAITACCLRGSLIGLGCCCGAGSFLVLLRGCFVAKPPRNDVVCLCCVPVLSLLFACPKSKQKGQQASDYRLLPVGFPDWLGCCCGAGSFLVLLRGCFVAKPPRNDVVCLCCVPVLSLLFACPKSKQKGQQASDYRLLPAGFPDWAGLLLWHRAFSCVIARLLRRKASSQ